MDRSNTGGGLPRTRKIVYSTTDGRQRFPDILQVSYGEKAVIGFDRYGRALGAVVPMEAVQMLAGMRGSVDQDIQDRIQRAAQALMEEIHDQGQPLELEDIELARREDRRASAEPSSLTARTRKSTE